MEKRGSGSILNMGGGGGGYWPHLYHDPYVPSTVLACTRSGQRHGQIYWRDGEDRPGEQVDTRTSNKEAETCNSRPTNDSKEEACSNEVSAPRGGVGGAPLRDENGPQVGVSNGA